MAISDEKRAEIHRLLTTTSMSHRAIAEAVGVGHATVSRLAAGVRRPETGADLLTRDKLDDALVSVGISRWQFDRWRAKGLLPGPVADGGGARGLYPAALVDQAMAVSEMVRRYRSLDRALLALFAAGFEVDGDRVRALLCRLVDEKEQGSRRRQQAYEQSGEQAEASFDRQVREARFDPRLKGLREFVTQAQQPPNLALEIVDNVAVADRALLEQPGAVAELGGLLRTLTSGEFGDAQVAALPNVASAMGLEAQRRAAQEASMADLREACSQMAALLAAAAGVEPSTLDYEMVAKHALAIAALLRSPAGETFAANLATRLGSPAP